MPAQAAASTIMMEPERGQTSVSLAQSDLKKIISSGRRELWASNRRRGSSSVDAEALHEVARDETIGSQVKTFLHECALPGTPCIWVYRYAPTKESMAGSGVCVRAASPKAGSVMQAATIDSRRLLRSCQGVPDGPPSPSPPIALQPVECLGATPIGLAASHISRAARLLLQHCCAPPKI